MANDLNRSIKIYLDNSSAMTSADQLQARIGELEKKLLDLQTAGKGNTDQAKKLEKELTAHTQKFEKYKREVADTERVLRNLSGATYNELIKAKKDIDKQLKSTTRNTELYNQRLQVQKAISKELLLAQKDMRTEIGSQASSWGRAADWINKYMGIIGSGIAAVTGITMAFNKLRDERNKLEESKADVKALTGLDDESIGWLTTQAKQLSTTVTKEGIRIRQSATEILEAYKLVGSAKPELLENKEALAAVTEQTLILASASGMKLTDAVDAVTLAMNQYGAGADEAAKYVNALAAGSKFGAVAVESQTGAIVKSGVSAAAANIPIEQLIGTIETLGEKGIKDEIAGTGLKKFFLTLQTGADDTNPKVVGLTTALENLREKQMDAAAVKKMFGEEGYNVASVLINEADKVDYYTKAVTGTSVAMEQAAIKSETAASKLDQARNKMTDMGIELMEKLNPAIASTLNATVNWTRKIVSIAEWISKNTGLIITLGIALTAYTAIVKTLTYWERIRNGGLLASVKTGKAWAVVTTTMKGAQIALAGAQALLTGNLVRARAAWALLNSTMILNPVVAIGVAIAALTVGIYKLATRTTDAKEAMDSFMESSIKEQTELNKLYGALKRSGEGTGQRIKLIDEFNTKYGEYLPNLLSEKSTLEEIKTAYENATIAMRENLAQKTLDAKIEEIETNALEDKVKELNDVREKLSILPKSMIADAISSIVSQVEEGKNQGQKLEVVWRNVAENIRAVYFDNGNLPAYFGNALDDYVQEVYNAADKVKAVKEELAPFLPVQELPETVITAKGTNKKDKHPVVGKPTKDSEFKAAIDLKLKEMENTHSSELALLKKQKLESGQTEQFYNLQVLNSDAVYYQQRLVQLQDYLKKAGNKKMQAEINKQIIDIQTKQLEIEQKRDKEVISALQDNRDKQLRIVESGSTQQKTVLEKAVAEQKMTHEQADALSLSLDAETAEKRLAIYQGYQNDILSLELNNGPEKAKAIEDASKAVLDADLKAAQSRANQQKALQDLLKDFKGQFNLTTVGEETEMQLKVLDDVYKAKKEMAIKDKLDTTELDAAYEKAKTNIVKQEEDKRYQIRQQYGLVSMKEEYDTEMETLREQYKQGLIQEEEYNKAKANIKIKYLKKSFDYYSDMFSGAISALQDAELANIDAKYDAEIQRAGDNTEEVARLEKEKENKKLAVQKKYAGVQFAIKVSEIIANTAVAIMQAFAQLGPVAGAIAAAMLTTTGIAQVAVANAERKKIMSMTADSSSSSGSGTGARIASGSTSGFYVGGWSGDGSPFEVAGPVHRKEYVVPSFVMSEPAAMNHVGALEAMRRQKTNANPLPLPVAGFANGGYAGDAGGTQNGIGVTSATEQLLIALLTSLNKNGVRAHVVYSDIEAAKNTLDKSKRIGGK